MWLQSCLWLTSTLWSQPHLLWFNSKLASNTRARCRETVNWLSFAGYPGAAVTSCPGQRCALRPATSCAWPLVPSEGHCLPPEPQCRRASTPTSMGDLLQGLGTPVTLEPEHSAPPCWDLEKSQPADSTSVWFPVQPPNSQALSRPTETELPSQKASFGNHYLVHPHWYLSNSVSYFKQRDLNFL